MNNGHEKTFQELLSAYYGGTPVKRRKKKQRARSPITFSKVFDNGDNLMQKNTEPPFEEYVVMQSATAPEEPPFEEYVVQASVPDAEVFEEYVVRASVESSGAAQPYAAPASFSEPSTASPLEEYGWDLVEPQSVPENSTPLEEPAMPPDSIPQIGTLVEQRPTGNNTPPSKAVSEATSTDKDFEEDFQAILSGQKVFDPVTKKTVDKKDLGKQQSTPPPAAPAQTEFSNGHAIFDEIAKKMQYATAYDLGVVELDKRFSDFDRVSELQKLANTAKVKRSQAMSDAVVEKAATIKPDIDTSDFIHDLDAIRRGSRGEILVAKSSPLDTATAPVVPDIHSTEWPLRPANLRPLRFAEKIQEFGQFTYVDDPSHFGGDGIRVTNDWATQNIVSVPIPQLNGKTFGGHVITNGTINFHRNGADRLRSLWAAWENAGLLDRILTFEGGYAARYIRRTQHRSPRPLSNHAWGTAFDINAAFNGFGVQPALVGQRGCVRELVAIANQNGFFWGGHFTTKDGMHFEIGHAV
jgi:hypothetical protein